MIPATERRRRVRLPGGLKWRLTAWVAAVLLAAAGVVFAVVHQQTGTQLRHQIDSDIREDVTQFARTLETTPARSRAVLLDAARAYVTAQPYTAFSRLLFAVVPGSSPVSNHPEAIGPAPPRRAETVADQVAENALGRRLTRAANGYSVYQLPDAGMVRIFARHLHLVGTTVTVGAGEPLGIVTRAEDSVTRTFLLAGAIVLLIALVASYLAGAYVSAPLREMAAVAARIDAGDLDPRMQTRLSQSREIQVLGDAFNRMLDRLGAAFAGQRAFVADASHELRTPLTVIRGQLEVLATEADPRPADIRRVEELVGVEVSRISRLVDDLLVLASAEHTDFLRPETVEVEPFVADLWDGLSRTADRRFELELEPDASGTVLADPDRLAQALGNLIRNAIAHTPPASGLVRLEASARAGVLRFAVDDNGPGIPPEEREQVFERFHRTDVARTRSAGGTGLGLAIVRAIAESHGGRVRAIASAHGGARLEFELPGFTPRSARRLEHRYVAPR